MVCPLLLHFKSTPEQYNNASIYSAESNAIGKYLTFNLATENPDLFSSNPIARANAQNAYSTALVAALMSNGIGSAAGNKLTPRVEQPKLPSTTSEFVPVVRNTAAQQALSEVASNQPVLATERGYINGSKMLSGGSILESQYLSPEQQAIAKDIMIHGDGRGNKTESLISSVIRDAGFEELTGAKLGPNNGFDHVAKNPDGSVTIIMDSKQLNTSRGVQLGESNAGLQLSKSAIDLILKNLPDDSPAKIAIKAARNSQTLKTAVAGVDKKSGNVIITPIKVKE